MAFFRKSIDELAIIKHNLALRPHTYHFLVSSNSLRYWVINLSSMQAQDAELYEAYTKETDLGVGLGYNFCFRCGSFGVIVGMTVSTCICFIPIDHNASPSL